MNNKEYPKVVIGALIYNDNNEIFLAKSYKWGNKWVVPDGHLEWGETLFECTRREVKEETNLDVANIELVRVQESILSKEYHKPKHMVFLDYSCKAISEDIKLNDELQEYVWITPKEALKKLELGKSTAEFINNFISKKLTKS